MIRPKQSADLPEVQRMMHELWPAFDGNIDEDHIWVSGENGELNGFLSLSVRPWVEGAQTAPCPHIEGWFVDIEERGKGVGRALIRSAEEWCRGQGFLELTSDADVTNISSLDAHEALGFRPTIRLQYFRKQL